MNSNNQTIQDCSNLPMDPTGNNFALQTLNNNSVGRSNIFINTVTPAPQNVTFEFYLPFTKRRTYLSRDLYTELHPLENARLLNNGINVSHIPDHQFPHHYNVQSLIQQQIQQVQQVQQPVVYQQNSIQQQSFDTFDTSIQPTYQVHSNNSAYNTASISVNGTISGDMQDTGFQNSS